MNRLVKGIAALAATLALVVGVPALLVGWGRLDVLRSTDWSAVWSVPDDGSLLLLLLTVVGWLAWAAITLSFGVEILAVVRRRPALRLPGLGWAQPVAASLVIAIAGLAFAGAITPARAAPLEVDARVAPPAESVFETRDSGQQEATRTAKVPAGSSPTHLTERGDDLWSLAQRYYGDGARWREIRDANPGLDAAAHLYPGQVLIVPGVENAATVHSIVVSEGDTLSQLAATHLGDAERWPELMHANRDRIDHPDVIQPGWVLRVPETKAIPGAVPCGDQSLSGDDAPSDRATAPPAPARLDHDVDVPAPADAWVPEVVQASAPVQAPAPPPPSTVSTDPSATEAGDPARAVVGGLVGLLALSLTAGIAVRRQGQLLQRGLGQRILHASAEAQRFESALARVASAAEDTPVTATTVILGLDGDDLVLHDLAPCRLTWLACPDAELRPQIVAALVTSLVGASWSAQVAAQVVGAELAWARSFDNPLSRVWSASEDGLAALERSAAGRRLELARQGSAILAEWDPEVYLFADPLGADQVTRLAAALDGPDVGVSAVLTATSTPIDLVVDQASVVEYGGATASIGGRTFVPQLLDAPARHALVELHEVVGSLATTPAPWWSEDDDLPPSIALLPRRTTHLSEESVDPFVASPHPVLRLLGPIELQGARGPVPPRAVKQCVEYAAWIHAHPGRRAVHMMRSLLVAEGTRRSNMSRLRMWLGDAPDGEPYLPDAYSGVIALHPGVTSDWERLQTLVHGGVNRASSDALADALQLVRGAPLADAAPGQWHWAEELRTDMASTIRDIGAVLADRALDAGDLDLARWAASRALVAAPEDELLMCARIRTEHLAGSRAEVDRLVLHLTRQARVLGIDLADETVDVLQEVVEGRPRARRA